MSVAFESVSTRAFGAVGSGGTFTIDKPTGLAVGDLMVAHLTALDVDKTASTSSLGWTEIVNQNKDTNTNSSVNLTVQWVIADAGHVAASSYTVTHAAGDATNYCGGAIYRISGAYLAEAAVGTDTDDATPEFANTITPGLADSLLLFLTSVSQAAVTSGTCSGYAITTSNPSWTERVDFYQGYPGGANLTAGLMAGASATRPETTATGNSTCSYSNHQQNSVGAIIVLSPYTNASVTAEPFVESMSIPVPSITASGNVTAVEMGASMSMPSPTITSPSPTWTNTDKSTAPTWTNTKKT